MTARCKTCGKPIMLLVLAGWQHFDLLETFDHEAEEQR